MAGLVFMLLLFAMAGHSSASWCVCREGVSNAALQKALDYACGDGADCGPIHQNGPCFNPDNVRAHCNYAVNSYFQRNRQQPTACDFSGTAAITNNDPSAAGCSYPATASATTTTTTPGTTTPVTGTTGGSPIVTTPTNGVIGGANGLPPSMSTDESDGGIRLPNTIFFCSSIALTFSALFFW